MALPVGAVRLGFLVLTFVHVVGPVLYGALWAIIPFAPGMESPLERAIRQVQGMLRGLFGTPPAGGASGGPSAVVPQEPAA